MSNYEDLEDSFNKMMEAFGDFDRTLRQMDSHLWEQWKAGGKAVSDEFISMYPDATQVLEQLRPDPDAEDDEFEDDEEPNK